MLGDIISPRHSQTVSFVLCYTKKTDSFSDGAQTTPLKPNAPFEKKIPASRGASK